VVLLGVLVVVLPHDELPEVGGDFGGVH
jgi:hypothetical protein